MQNSASRHRPRSAFAGPVHGGRSHLIEVTEFMPPAALRGGQRSEIDQCLQLDLHQLARLSGTWRRASDRLIGDICQVTIPFRGYHVDILEPLRR